LSRNPFEAGTNFQCSEGSTLDD